MISKPCYALVIDIEKTGCDMMLNNVVAFGAVVVDM